MNMPAVWAAALLTLWTTHSAGAAHTTAGRIDAVTVYRGQALITRVVDVPGPAGLQEIVITDLPERVVPGSIYAESADGVIVRSVRYRVRHVAEDVRDDVRKLDEQMALLRDELDANERQRRVILDERAYLDQLNGFTAPAATAELTSGVLNADTLKSLTTFVFEQRRRLSDEELAADRRKREIEAELNLLQRNRDVLTGGSARTAREAVVFVELRGDGGAMRVRYLVEEASWSPSYNVRAGDAPDRVALEYNAAIQQRSGEDWNDVTMTLSTATPTLVARAPQLTPLRIGLADIVPEEGKAAYEDQLGALLQRKKQFESARNSPAQVQQQADAGNLQVWSSLDNYQNDFNLNSVAAELQVLDLVAAGQVRSAKGARREESVSVTYLLSGRSTLPSRSDLQSIQIAALQLPANFYKVASPVLTDYIYDEASLVNDTPLVLLAGPVAAYAAGQFVGHGDIPTIVAGQRFEVGFGVDSSLRSSRELLERKEEVRGGNRVVSFKYRLTVENFAAEAAAIRLLDRLPVTRLEAVQVSLAESQPPLCADREYLHGPRKDGILRWDAQVPANATGPDAFTIDYAFQLEYDKAKSITGLAQAG